LFIVAPVYFRVGASENPGAVQPSYGKLKAREARSRTSFSGGKEAKRLFLSGL
jgi:hypothetical protein